MSTVYETFITQDEIELITGYKRPHEQKKWLNSNGWQFLLDRAGRPVIHREVMNSRFGVIGEIIEHNEEEFVLNLNRIK